MVTTMDILLKDQRGYFCRWVLAPDQGAAARGEQRKRRLNLKGSIRAKERKKAGVLFWFLLNDLISAEILRRERRQRNWRAAQLIYPNARSWLRSLTLNFCVFISEEEWTAFPGAHVWCRNGATTSASNLNCAHSNEEATTGERHHQ